MKVVILCGGYGTRLAGTGADLPKPMVPIGGRPIVWHIMRGFAHWGFDDFVLCLGYRSDSFKQYFLNLPLMTSDIAVDLATGRTTQLQPHPDELQWKILLAETGLESMTGHRLKRIASYIPPEDDCFAVTYGDGVTDLDFREVVKFHRAHGKLATVTGVRPPARFGELTLGPAGQVTEFNEKLQASGGWISGGFFVFARRFLEELTDDPGLVLERDPLQQLAHRGELRAYLHEGFWFCMDTPRDYQHLQYLWSAQQAPWAVWKLLGATK